MLFLRIAPINMSALEPIIDSFPQDWVTLFAFCYLADKFRLRQLTIRADLIKFGSTWRLMVFFDKYLLVYELNIFLPWSPISMNRYWSILQIGRSMPKCTLAYLHIVQTFFRKSVTLLRHFIWFSNADTVRQSLSQSFTRCVENVKRSYSKIHFDGV